MKIFAALLSAALAFLPAPASSATVSVAYAGSLVATMEGPIAQALLRNTGLRFLGEAKGSRALAHLIAAGLRQPDVFISAEPSLLRPLANSYTIFGSARMVIGYSAKAPHAALLAQAAAGRIPLLDALAAPGLRSGRTDPQLDPKGARTVRAITILGQLEHRSVAARALLLRAQTFPEEDLAVRVETGQLDAGFFYSIETAPLGLRTVELPAGANLSAEITFAIAILPHPHNPRAARQFEDFLLRGKGRSILEAAGLSMFARPRVVKGSPSI